MEFFQQLAALDLKGTFVLTIAPSTAGMVVAVRLDNENVTDAAKKNIPPLILRGTAASLTLLSSTAFRSQSSRCQRY